MRLPCSWRISSFLFLFIFIFCVLFTNAQAQDLRTVGWTGHPYYLSGHSPESDMVPLSSGMFDSFLPKIPNLQVGFLYCFGNKVRTGRFTADYVLPFNLGCDSVLFGEAHAEALDFWKRSSASVAAAPGFTVTTSDTSNRVDLSFGGGYRRMLCANALLGVNGFYDTSHLFNKWYSSGGIGLEMAANIAGDDAFDLNFNWYGNLFKWNGLVNAFRNKGNSFDVEAGYSHAIFNRSLDLRFKIVGYQFDIGDTVQGWRGGADLTTPCGVFRIKYEYGHDRINGDYNSVGAFVTAGFQLENVLKGESPITYPERVFKCSRNLRRLLTLKVKRDWHQPAAVVVAKSIPPTPAPSPTSSLTATAIGFGTIPAVTTVGVGLTPSVTLSDTAAFSSLTVTFSSPAPPGGGLVGLFTDTSQFTGFVSFPGGATSVTITKAANPTFFGGGGITGTVYNFVNVANNDATNTWTPGFVTFTWQ
jgi:Inverse autotransporter, beta-domain